MKRYKNLWRSLLIFCALPLLLAACAGREPGKQEIAKQVYGQWQGESGVLYTLLEDGRFYWHRNIADLTNDYYYGTMEVINGEEALQQLDITEKEWKSRFATEVKKKERVFCVNLTLQELFHSGQVVQEPLGQGNGDTVQLCLMLLDSNTALYRNNSTGVEGRLSRVEEWLALPDHSSAGATLGVPQELPEEEQDAGLMLQMESDDKITVTGTVAYNAQWYDSAGGGWQDCYILAVRQQDAQELATLLGVPTDDPQIAEIQLLARDEVFWEDYLGQKVTVTGSARAAHDTQHRRPMVFKVQAVAAYQ